MKTSRSILFAVCVLALGCVFEPAPVESEPLGARPSMPLDGALAQLELSDGQRYEIEALLRSEEPWSAKLEHDRHAAEAALRAAEVRQPFDSTRVGTLIQRKAEILAYQRGAESRVVSEILEILEPAQRSAFSLLRSEHLAGKRVATSQLPTLVSALP